MSQRLRNSCIDSLAKSCYNIISEPEREKKKMKTYTVEVLANGTRYWYLKGVLHREDGPAVEYSDGTKCWF
jgi:hypothetical protein